jgi:hypothetical protein
MRNETLVNHVPTAITETIMFLSQIAILAATMSPVVQEDGRNTWMTYVRITINSEAEAQAVAAKT